jgi:putative DNA primase/helicase
VEQGPGLTAPSLAKLLHRYGIKPRSVRIGEETAKGYKLEAFGDAFQRYLEEPSTLTDAVSDVTTSQPASVNGSGAFPSRHTTHLVTATEEGSNPHEQPDVTGVTAEIPDTEEADYYAERFWAYESEPGS